MRDSLVAMSKDATDVNRLEIRQTHHVPESLESKVSPDASDLTVFV